MAVLVKAPYLEKRCRVRGDPGGPVVREQYRDRWKAETSMLVAKRRCGEPLSVRREEVHIPHLRTFCFEAPL
jgi:hypothetical protein